TNTRRCQRLLSREEGERVERRRILRIARQILDAFPCVQVRRRITCRDREDKNCGGENVVGCCPVVGQRALGIIHGENWIAPANGELTREQNVNRLWSFSLGKQLIDLGSGSR